VDFWNFLATVPDRVANQVLENLHQRR
jgi:hypothetical protein